MILAPDVVDRIFNLALLNDDSCRTQTLQLEIVHDRYKLFSVDEEKVRFLLFGNIAQS